MNQALLIASLLFPLTLYALSYRNYAIFISPIPLLGAVTALLATAATLLTGQAISFEILALGLRLDALSGLISCAVLTIGGVVMRYSARYMEDDPNRTMFMRNIACVLSCVLLMLLSENLGVLIAAWAGSSFFLHKLLLHYSDRPKARQAAEQKFWISRLGDLFLVGGALLLHGLFGTLNFSSIFELAGQANLSAQDSLSLELSLCMISAGALIKSAQYPFHFWLPKSLESATPVSALIHAGVINAGGYLLIRLSPVLIHVDTALSILLLIGTVTTIYGALVMVVQPDIKKQLAYSTIAQMGFMMVQCGIGAFQLASLHIVGHAFYKSYAFLNSGAAAQLGKIRKLSAARQLTPQDNLWPQVMAIAAAALAFLALLWVTGISLPGKAGGGLLSFVLILAMAQALLSSERRDLGISFAALMGVGYFLLSALWSLLLRDTVPMEPLQYSALHAVMVLFSVLAFIGLYIAQNNLHRFVASKTGNRLYVYLLNGGYLGR